MRHGAYDAVRKVEEIIHALLGNNKKLQQRLDNTKKILVQTQEHVKKLKAVAKEKEILKKQVIELGGVPKRYVL